MNYDFDKKEAATKAKQDKKDVFATADKKRQQLFLLFLVVLALSIAIIAIIIFRGLQQSKKAKKVIELQRDEITQQKETVEKQKVLVEEKQKEIVDSITYAKRIQYTLLANKQLMDNNLSDHFILFKPKDIVSGDFYWATKRENKFYLAVCDSTGHGVPGAFMSLLNISFLNEAVNEKNIVEPHKILNHVRKRLIENMDGGQDGMDAILICIDGKGITYAAANNSPAIIKNGTILSLPTDKMPVGKGVNTAPFTLRAIELEKGDSLYLYTDGYADQFGGPKGKKFKYKPLNELLIANQQKSCSEQKENLAYAFYNWKGNLEQVDDILVIGITM
jgi:serine phosphatase RsbU (regulator of sigma subunit)